MAANPFIFYTDSILFWGKESTQAISERWSRKRRQDRQSMWMNPNKYTFLFDWLTDLIIQTATQSSETTGPDP